MKESLISRPAAAAYLGVQPQTLAAWACTQRYPLPFVKIGRRVMYRLADLEAFVLANRRDFGAMEVRHAA
ncbi:helix-turn-helix domain-containing protein [Burkholderia sp. LMG 21824]|uniref:helix-turn-helix domain-containing protein n=1 Tax=Burkholderia sp. LMG 21824 TaxID=3158172 RepID=UPI003C2F19CD